MSIKYWWSDDFQWFCILVDDGTSKATVSLTREQASELSMRSGSLPREEREIERFNQLGRDLNAVNPRHHLDDLILNPQSEDNAVPPQSLGDAT